MPIVGIETYLPTMDEFLAHWTQVNAALGTSPLTLQGGYGRADLLTDRTNLAALIASVGVADSGQQMAAAGRDAAKMTVRPRVAQFRGAVKGLLPGTPFEAALPVQPLAGAVASRFLKPLDDMASLWTAINTTSPAFPVTNPLKLAGGYVQAQFATDVAMLRTQYAAVGQADQTAKLARDRRDAVLPGIKARLIQYRNAVVSAFPPGSPLILSLPAVTPPAGATPQPVAVSGLWNSAASKGQLTWTPSLNPRVTHYAIRTSPGSTYRTRDEVTVGSVPADATSFLTETGLAAPGATALFKVYVMTSTGNQRGSATVEIARPA